MLADGRALIDGIASWWTACHGYNHPHIRAAVERQLAAMPHVMFGGLVHEQALTLARRLAALLPGDLDRVFFSESGSVAVEVAMKMAVQYWLNRGVRGRSKFVAFNGAYHGDTAGAMAVSDGAGMHGTFRGLLPAHFLVDLPTDDARAAAFSQLLERHADEIAGIIVEPLVQGAGGMRFHDRAVLRSLRRLADRYDLLLIFDEIFTGFGRTGTMFACEQAGVVPDIITVGKALTRRHAAAGGHHRAAQGLRRVLVGRSQASADAWADLHGQCARLRRRQCLARPVRARAAARAGQADFLGLGRRSCAVPRDARRKGRARDGRNRRGRAGADRWNSTRCGRVFVEEGVVVRPLENVIYLTPSFTIEPGELKKLTDAIAKVIR